MFSLAWSAVSKLLAAVIIFFSSLLLFSARGQDWFCLLTSQKEEVPWGWRSVISLCSHYVPLLSGVTGGYTVWVSASPNGPLV